GSGAGSPVRRHTSSIQRSGACRAGAAWQVAVGWVESSRPTSKALHEIQRAERGARERPPRVPDTGERKRLMKRRIGLLRLGLAVLCLGLLFTPGAWTDNQKNPEEDVLQKRAEAFVAAFNQGDAKSMASFFTPNADIVDPEGRHIKGREAITKAYAKY